MQELTRLRPVAIDEDGVSPRAGAAILLPDDGQSLLLDVTSLHPDVAVSPDVGDELPEGVQWQVR